MGQDSTHANTQSASLGDVIRHVGPESQVTWLGDTRHGNVDQQLALMSTDTVKAAADAGKKYMIVEALSDPRFEGWSKRFNNGEVTAEQLHDACMTLSQPFAQGEALNKWREAAYDMFVSMKENGVQLLSVDRQLDKPMDAYKNYPQFAELRRRMDEYDNMPADKRDAAGQLIADWATRAIGPDFIEKYKDWKANVVTAEQNERDTQGMKTSIARANGAGVLMTWGDGHNKTNHDIDEAIGKKNVKIVTVYGSEQQEQIQDVTGSVRTQLPDYVYYLKEQQVGKPDQRIDIDPAHTEVLTPEAKRIVQENSLLSSLTKGFDLKHSFPVQDENRAALCNLAATSTKANSLPVEVKGCSR